MAQQLNLKSLKKAGLDNVGAPVKKTIELTNDAGEKIEFETYVRKRSYKTAVASLHAINSNSDKVAAYLSSSICDADGKEVFTLDEVEGLPESLTYALLAAIGEVNSVKKQN